MSDVNSDEIHKRPMVTAAAVGESDKQPPKPDPDEHHKRPMCVETQNSAFDIPATNCLEDMVSPADAKKITTIRIEHAKRVAEQLANTYNQILDVLRKGR